MCGGEPNRMGKSVAAHEGCHSSRSSPLQLKHERLSVKCFYFHHSFRTPPVPSLFEDTPVYQPATQQRTILVKYARSSCTRYNFRVERAGLVDFQSRDIRRSRRTEEVVLLLTTTDFVVRPTVGSKHDCVGKAENEFAKTFALFFFPMLGIFTVKF